MLKSQASVATPQAEQFMFKLAKHFAKKIPVELQPQHARLAFEFGLCEMSAPDPATLCFDCQAADAASQARLHGVLDSHLQLMTRREPLLLQWRTL